MAGCSSVIGRSPINMIANGKAKKTWLKIELFSLVLLSKYIKKFLSKFYKMEMPISSIRVPKPFSLGEPLKAFFCFTCLASQSLY